MGSYDWRTWQERPANRVDNVFIWADGYSRNMTLRERIEWFFGRRKFYRYP